MIYYCKKCKEPFKKWSKSHMYCSDCSPFSLEKRRKISESKLGDKNPAKREDVRKKISIANSGERNSNYQGKLMTPEARLQRRIKLKGVMVGEKNGNWKGGISLDPYPLVFDNTLKEQIRQRDNYTCQLCSRNQTENGKRLAIHHIDYDKENCEPINLISLCKVCNSKVNGERTKWFKYFTIKVTRREVLQSYDFAITPQRLYADYPIKDNDIVRTCAYKDESAEVNRNDLPLVKVNQSNNIGT